MYFMLRFCSWNFLEITGTVGIQEMLHCLPSFIDSGWNKNFALRRSAAQSRKALTWSRKCWALQSLESPNSLCPLKLLLRPKSMSFLGESSRTLLSLGKTPIDWCFQKIRITKYVIFPFCFSSFTCPTASGPYFVMTILLAEEGWTVLFQRHLMVLNRPEGLLHTRYGWGVQVITC